MAALLTEAAEIRKLRKKLRQIENLERLTRPLDEQEQVKVDKKYDIRERLQDLLDRVDSDTPTNTQPAYENTQSTLPSPSSPLEGAEGDAWNVPHGESGERERVVASIRKGGGKGVNEEDDVKRTVPPAENRESHRPQSPGDRPAEKPAKKGKKEDWKKTKANPWAGISVVVSELDGHSDVVTSVTVQGTTLVSASRDTTVKVWDLETEQETGSFGGHEETVTSVLILTPEETARYKDEDDAKDNDSYIISGSTDCTLKVWSLKSGKLVKSVYTFNPVTCLDYSYSSHLLITASDGGKVEVWDVKTGTNVFSVRAHEDAVTAMKVLNNTVITSDAEGLVMVHEIRAGSLVRVFVSEDVKVMGSGRVNQRMIRSLTASDKMVVIGDDAVNLKLLDWKKGVVRKVVNHVSEFSSTDAVYLWEDVLFSSSFDLDTGYGYINIRSMSSGEYLASLDDEDMEGTERIVCLAATRLRSGHGVLVSGGAQLKVWRMLPEGHSIPESSDEKWVTVTQFLPALAQQARDSEAESDMEEEDDDDDDTDDNDEKKRRDDNGDAEATSWMSWCSIV